MTVKTTSDFSMWLLASGVMCDPKVIPTPTQTRLPVLPTPFTADRLQDRVRPFPPSQVAADYAELRLGGNYRSPPGPFSDPGLEFWSR